MTDDLPEGWALSTIGEVVELNPSKPPQNAYPSDLPVTFLPMPAVDADSGTITAPEQRTFGQVRKGYTAFQENDVLFAKITPCMENGKATIARTLTNGLGFGSTEFHVLRPNGAVIPEYIYHYIRQESFRRDAEAEMTGSVGQKRVPPGFVYDAEIPLPPLTEQKRIVEKVEELLARVNAARDRLEEVPKIMKRFRQSVLAAACSGRLTEDWREKNSVTTDWETVYLKDVAHLRLGKMLDKAKNVGRPTPYLQNTNVRWFGFDLSDVASMPSTPDETRLLAINCGDLLVCEGGEPGRCAVW